MRPPSYYSSLANQNNSMSAGRSSSLLRSSFSNPSSSSYASRTHLPFVAQSMLVAHCFTGSGSTNKPYLNSNAHSTYSSSYASANLSSSYTRPKSISRQANYSSRTYSGYSPSSLSSSSYISSSSRTPSYRTRPTLATSSYYKPIRLRERPLLAQISAPNRPQTTEHSQLIKESHKSEESNEAKNAKEAEANWSSDIARNISRNKYLIKFREFDKRPSIPIQQTNRIDDKEAKVETETMTRISDNQVGSINSETVKKNDSELEVKKEAKEKSVECDTNKSVESKEFGAEEKKKRRNIKLKIKTANSSAASPEEHFNVEIGKQVKKVATNQLAEGSQSEAPIKPKVKRAAKASKPKLVADETLKSGKSSEVKKEQRKVLAEKQEEQKSSIRDDEKQLIDSKQSAAATTTTTTTNKRIRFREYNIDDFNFLSVLGHGGWGFVVLAELKEHDACFAVKCIKKITIVEDDDFDSIMIERKVLALGNINPFICKLFCTFETEGYLFFVMEYCAGGDLMFHVQREGKFTESRSRFYAAEIICAIRFLHNRHIIYRDLKLDNILLDSKGHIRLVDFGMCQCRTYREEMLPSNFCGTPEYISPEIIKGVPYNHSVDWWSFGVLLYEMAVGKMPFRGNDENELLWNVCYEQIHYPMFLTRELTALLQLLLEREPAKRMGMSTCKSGDIKDQPWFSGINWSDMEELRVNPPFVPEVSSKCDVQNFDADFTQSAPELSPVAEETLRRIDQNQFLQFPYTNPNIFIFDSV